MHGIGISGTTADLHRATALNKHEKKRGFDPGRSRPFSFLTFWQLTMGIWLDCSFGAGNPFQSQQAQQEQQDSLSPVLANRALRYTYLYLDLPNFRRVYTVSPSPNVPLVLDRIRWCWKRGYILRIGKSC